MVHVDILFLEYYFDFNEHITAESVFQWRTHRRKNEVYRSQIVLHFGALSVRLSGVSFVLMAVFCDDQLCLVSCSCEYFSSVPSCLLSIGP